MARAKLASAQKPPAQGSRQQAASLVAFMKFAQRLSYSTLQFANSTSRCAPECAICIEATDRNA